MKGSAIFLPFYLLFFHTIYAAELDIISDSRFLTDEDTLVSATRVFELGFFRPGSSENRYLGIWYKKISIKTVVWVANRDHPLAPASSNTVKISNTGILVLFNNISGIVWSTKSTSSQNATAKLLDNGNLVVMDKTLDESDIWQSFDYPTDTYIPGMKYGRDFLTGKEWFLSSWKSSQDPAPGEFSWRLDTNSYPQNILKQGDVVKFRWPLSSLCFDKDSLLDRNVSLTYDNETVVAFSYNLDDNSTAVWRFTLNPSGELERWVWVEDDKKWQLLLQLPQDICDTYNMCNGYGSCSVTSSQSTCACLDAKRFMPRNQKSWEIAVWSGGCVRRTRLDCKNGTDGFVKYSNLKLPDAQSSWFNRSMTRKECEAKCLEDCTCMAYANTDIRFEGSGCLLWFGDITDIREIPHSNGGQDIFVRMASSELVVDEKGGANIKIILIVLFSGGLLIGFGAKWFWQTRIIKNHGEPTEEGQPFNVSESQEEAMVLPLFNFSTIANATARFSHDNKLGEGGFGCVYKGLLENGLEIAVKRLSKTSTQGVEEFKNEAICISKLQHRNLVKLLGCCIQREEKLLVYEYLPNGSLDSFIFDRTQSMLLDWTKRFSIIKGIARGLIYLHQDSRLRIIHRDLKASNILLDLNMNPKISDFGMARSFGGNETHANTKRVVGTYGYMSPEYALNGIFSIKSDVFSFGVLVLEIVSGKRNWGFIHPEHDNNLIGHAWSLYIEGRAMELVDESLAESCHPSEVLRSIQVGLLCVQQYARDRPNMSFVIRMLDGEGVLMQPKQPAFFLGRELLGADYRLRTHPPGSINGLSITKIDGR